MKYSRSIFFKLVRREIIIKTEGNWFQTGPWFLQTVQRLLQGILECSSLFPFRLFLGRNRLFTVRNRKVGRANNPPPTVLRISSYLSWANFFVTIKIHITVTYSEVLLTWESWDDYTAYKMHQNAPNCVLYTNRIPR